MTNGIRGIEQCGHSANLNLRDPKKEQKGEGLR
jgi:hypothetical protein